MSKSTSSASQKAGQMQVLLVGNPNVGKSLLFSRLTGTRVITSNFPGTTVGITHGSIRCTHKNCTEHQYRLIDAPGIYSLDAYEHDAEKVAGRMIAQSDLLINVLDATKLERNLFLTLQLLAAHPDKVVVVLNLWDEAHYHGIEIDVHKLANLLNAPVITSVGLTGKGSREIAETITKLLSSPLPKDTTASAASRQSASWEAIRVLVAAVQQTHNRPKRFQEYLETISLSPLWGPLIAVGVLVVTFFLVANLGEWLENLLGAVFVYGLTPIFLRLHTLLQSTPFLQHVLIGSVSNNAIDYGQAMGILTSGLYIPLVKVAPVVTIFYALIGFLEDCGYLPRLAILSDTLMHRFALHGFAIVPMVLGAGCNVTGIMATRMLPNRKQRLIASLLVSIAIPCTSQTAMIIGAVPSIGWIGVGIIFSALFIIWLVLGWCLGKRERQSYSELLMELPPYRMPHLPSMMHKLQYRLRQFFGDAIPITIAGISIILLCHQIGLLNAVGHLIGPAAHALWGIPSTMAPVLVMGLFRKEIAMGFLYAHTTTPQIVATTILMLSLFFPCVSVYTTLYREFGAYTLMAMVGIMFAIASLAGMLMHTIFLAFPLLIP